MSLNFSFKKVFFILFIFLVSIDLFSAKKQFVRVNPNNKFKKTKPAKKSNKGLQAPGLDTLELLAIICIPYLFYYSIKIYI